MEAGGAISIGSDSNILISLSEELRVLDTTQRLRDHTRAALADSAQSTGRRIFQAACEGGAKAAGRGTGGLAVGEWADMTALDSDHVNLQSLAGDTVLDAFIFTQSAGMIADVWSAGRHVVQNGHHIAREKILQNYARAVAPLREGL